MISNGRLLAVCLTGVLVSLLVVGVVSSTLLRHVVQVVPILLVLVARFWRQQLTAYCALPIFMIWALLMLLIWLYLLGIATFFSGSFSPIEIALTILIGAFSVVGIVSCLRSVLHVTSVVSHCRICCLRRHANCCHVDFFHAGVCEQVNRERPKVPTTSASAPGTSAICSVSPSNPSAPAGGSCRGKLRVFASAG